VRRALLALATTLAFAPSARSTEPPDDENRACFAAVDDGQRLRIAHRLVEARERFVTCARPVCPSLFRSDCAEWLSQVQKALPSVVLGAKDPAGQDLIDVRVFVDGRPTVDKLEGTSSDVDPGPHVFRFEWEGHGVVEQRAVVREGEKDRQITVAFSDATSAQTRPPGSRSTTPVGVFLLGGLGIAGGAAFAALYASTAGSVSQLRTTCAPNCSNGAVEAQEIKYGLGYASLAVGIASIGVATTWFILSRSKAGEATSVSVAPAPDGGRVSLAVSF
jgi:hypothetical protein